MSLEQRHALYELMPAVHRVRDATEGAPLRGLLELIDEQVEALEDDIDRLYDNWFIETCDEWVVPYLGDLLGVRGLLPVEGAGFSQRGLVADTIALRRAKGTAAVLEQLARDVTGWPAKAIEFFELLATTRAMNHERRSDVAFVDVRAAAQAELTGMPFGRAAHTADVRHVDNGRGRHNIPNVGIHLWRLQAYGVADVAANEVEARGRYTFDPLGGDVPLFNVPRAERGLTQLAAELNVPGRLRRRPLHDELEALRRGLAEERAAGIAPGAAGAPAEIEELRYFDERQPVLGVTLLTQSSAVAPVLRDEVPPEQILICNLSDSPNGPGWRRPPESKSYDVGGTEVEFPIAVGVDPVLGRLALPTGAQPTLVGIEVRYAYGFPGDLGGGPYDRRESVTRHLANMPPDRSLRHQWGVTADPAITGPGIVRTLRDAVTEWNALPPGSFGVIAVMDSRTYDEDLVEADAIVVPAGSRLLLAAAGWSVDEDPDGLSSVRRPGRLAPERRRPHVHGRIEVRGTAGSNPAAPGGELTIDGLLIDGDVTVLPGDLGLLELSHSTVVPHRRLLVRAQAATGDNRRLRVVIDRSICGRVVVDGRAHSMRVAESIVDGGGDSAIEAPALEVDGATVIGTTSARSIAASNSIFTAVVEAERRQEGCVRYCYVPLASHVPRRFRCQPENEAAADAVAPAFTSTTYGEPAYGQLARRCPPEIGSGAESGGEMGAYGFLQQPSRITNLTTRLDEFLRFGLEAGVFFVT